MADELKAVPGVEPTPLHSTSVTLDERKHKLSLILATKVDQGYTIESQTDTDAVITTRGRRLWFGLRGHAPGSSQRIAIDEQGRSTTRKHST